MKRRMFMAATGAAAGAAFGSERNPGNAFAPNDPAAAGAPFGGALARADQAAAYNGSWAGRPAANAVAMGTEIAITDVPAGGVTRWFSNGSTWRSTDGRTLLYSQAKGYKDPLGSLTWAGASISMALPGGSIKIPADMIEPGVTELRVSVLWATGPNTGGIGAQMTIGTGNSWSDTQCGGAFLGPNNEWDQVASFTFPTSRSMTQASPLTPLNGAPVGTIGAEYGTNIDVGADMYINFGTTAGGVFGNVLKIVRARVELFP